MHFRFVKIYDKIIYCIIAFKFALCNIISAVTHNYLCKIRTSAKTGKISNRVPIYYIGAKKSSAIEGIVVWSRK